MPVFDGPVGFNLGLPGPLRIVGLLMWDKLGVTCGVNDDELIVLSKVDGTDDDAVDSIDESEIITSFFFSSWIFSRFNSVEKIKSDTCFYELFVRTSYIIRSTGVTRAVQPNQSRHVS